MDAEARNNLDLLWQCLDRLPNGEPDLLGRELSEALKKLSAQPDPAAAANNGVQLMTIHKSKGLEFEVVIVPGLHAGVRKSSFKMLSWLERGLAQPDDTGEITEFLIAPFQPKGEDRGKAREWVDRQYRERECQEMRRVFYVAATRAREELHLFTRAEFKAIQWTSACLAKACSPSHGRHLNPKSAAASPTGNLSIAKPRSTNSPPAETTSSPWRHRRNPPSCAAFPRIIARLHHCALQQRRHASPATARMHYLPGMRAAWSRAYSAPRFTHSWKSSHACVQLLRGTTHAPRCIPIFLASNRRLAPSGWTLILRSSSPATRSKSPSALRRIPLRPGFYLPTPMQPVRRAGPGIANGAIHTVQVDRVFRAGPEPESEGDGTWWIIDYKSAHPELIDPAEALPRLRAIFAAQLETYAEVLRGLHGRNIEIRAGLYYPRLLAFDWWKL